MEAYYEQERELTVATVTQEDVTRLKRHGKIECRLQWPQRKIKMRISLDSDKGSATIVARFLPKVANVTMENADSLEIPMSGTHIKSLLKNGYIMNDNIVIHLAN